MPIKRNGKRRKSREIDSQYRGLQQKLDGDLEKSGDFRLEADDINVLSGEAQRIKYFKPTLLESLRC